MNWYIATLGGFMEDRYLIAKAYSCRNFFDIIDNYTNEECLINKIEEIPEDFIANLNIRHVFKTLDVEQSKEVREILWPNTAKNQ